MHQHGQLTNKERVRAFVLGGNAKFTLVSQKTGTRYTFKVRKADDGDVWFVSSLYGPDNEADYAYLGLLKTAPDRYGAAGFRVTAKSRFLPDSPQAKAFGYLWSQLPEGLLDFEELPEVLEFWHEGCCARCGRTLTVPSSIASGFGPECASKAGF
jgi:hypothetical protein